MREHDVSCSATYMLNMLMTKFFFMPAKGNEKRKEKHVGSLFVIYDVRTDVLFRLEKEEEINFSATGTI